MHIIVDIRSKHPEDAYMIRYAENWAKKWKQYSPNDGCTFLIFDDQEAPDGVAFLRAKNASWFSAKKPLKIAGATDILRVVNFSRYSPYDPMIPTVTHIFDMGRYFYDSATNANILRRKEREYELKRLAHHSSHIVVPNFFTGNEMVELWNVHESKIDIFPYLYMEPIDSADNELASLKILDHPYFLFDGTFGRESNLETLFLYFSKYQQNGGTFHLIMHGPTEKHLTSVMALVKKYSLEKVVHITGCLPNAVHESLYNHARAWIWCGAYYTGKTAIALANSKNLPLVVSDIEAFSLYPNAIKIHPNYPELLDTILYHIEKGEHFELPDAMKIDESLIFAQYKNILSKNQHLIV